VRTKLWQIITRRQRKVSHIKPVMPSHTSLSRRSTAHATVVPLSFDSVEGISGEHDKLSSGGQINRARLCLFSVEYATASALKD
jgi:hypothetical protein